MSLYNCTGYREEILAMKTFFKGIVTKLQSSESSSLGPSKYARPEKKYKEYEELDPDNTPQFLKL